MKRRSAERTPDISFDPSLTMRRWPRDPTTFAPGLDLTTTAIAVGNALNTGGWIYYPRDRNAYYPGSALHRAGITHANLTSVIDRLAESGRLQHERTRPSPKAAFRSRFRASPKLIALWHPIKCSDFHWQTPEILLRDGEKRDLPLPSSRTVRNLIAEVRGINDDLRRYDIGIRHPEVLIDEGGFWRVRGQRLNPLRKSYSRIFNGRFDLGGRLYRPFWQALPRDVRPGLLIDGADVVEIDIPGCHRQLVRALSGLDPFPVDRDPYAMLGIPREIAKQAFLLALNAETEISAIRALGLWIRECEIGAGLRPQSVYRDVLAAMPEVRICTGQALRLQYLDSRVCLRVHATCIALGIPALSVHDSFIAREADTRIVRSIVHNEFEGLCAKLRAGARSSY